MYYRHELSLNAIISSRKIWSWMLPVINRDVVLQKYFLAFALHTSTRKHLLWIATEWVKMFGLQSWKIDLKVWADCQRSSKHSFGANYTMVGVVFERLRKEQAVCQRTGNTQELQAASSTAKSHGIEINPGSAASGWKGTQGSMSQCLKCHPRMYKTGAKNAVCFWLKYFSRLVSTVANHIAKHPSPAGNLVKTLCFSISGKKKKRQFCSTKTVLLLFKVWKILKGFSILILLKTK